MTWTARRRILRLDERPTRGRAEEKKRGKRRLPERDLRTEKEAALLELAGACISKKGGGRENGKSESFKS